MLVFLASVFPESGKPHSKVFTVCLTMGSMRDERVHCHATRGPLS